MEKYFPLLFSPESFKFSAKKWDKNILILTYYYNICETIYQAVAILSTSCYAIITLFKINMRPVSIAFQKKRYEHK